MNNKNKKNHVRGRPLLIIDEIEFQVYYEKWMRHSKLNPFNLTEFARRLNISKSTLLRRLKIYKKKIEQNN
jgi:transcriptional antiterminator